jgi:uracil-DNA glycosylase
MTTSLARLLPEDWRQVLDAFLEAEAFRRLEAFVESERERGVVLPPESQTFAAFHQTPFDEVKVLILGQDPYPTPGVGNGLAFSVSPGVAIPPSLKNLFRGVAYEYQTPMPNSGDLSQWAQQGVLLLNAVLTVNAGASNSHRGKGWEPFVEHVVSTVMERCDGVVFFCLGKHAERLVRARVTDTRHAVVVAPHPSPLNGKKFEQHVAVHRPFHQVNALLRDAKHQPIDWTLA